MPKLSRKASVKRKGTNARNPVICAMMKSKGPQMVKMSACMN